jgi:hypothetical protein
MWNSIIRNLTPKLVQHANQLVLQLGSVRGPAHPFSCLCLPERGQKVKYHQWRHKRRTRPIAQPLAKLGIPCASATINGIPELIGDHIDGPIVAPSVFKALAAILTQCVQ